MPNREYKDVLVRISGVIGDPNTQPPVREMEINIDGFGGWRGKISLDLLSLDPSQPNDYGAVLGKQLSNPKLRQALNLAVQNRDGSGTAIRVRLQLDDETNAPHWIRWERIRLPMGDGDRRIATNPNILLSRYVPVDQTDSDPPDSAIFRLLYVIANPEGLDANREIKVEDEITSFLKPFQQGPLSRRLNVTIMPGRTEIGKELTDQIHALGWDVVQGPSTFPVISAQLASQFHGLHILAHGDFNPQDGTGRLLLESKDGKREIVEDSQLDAWITPNLQLIVFQACFGAAPPAEDHKPFTAMAPRLVQLGLPAAVAMQDEIEMSAARLFFAEFYRSILDEGVVDAAVNSGRRLLIDSSGSDTWSVPALFTRLKEGRLWNLDPLRQAVQTALDDLPKEDESARITLPIEVVAHSRGVISYDPAAGASGPRFDLWTKLNSQISVPETFTIVTGGRGFLKTSQLIRLFREKAASFLRADAGAAVPVLLRISELVSHDVSKWSSLQRVWTGRRDSNSIPELSGRRFLFLVDEDEELTGSTRQDALEALRRLRAVPNSSLCMAAEEDVLPELALDDFSDATLLVTQPLTLMAINTYLRAWKSDAASKLAQELRDREYIDLACQPRFLHHLLNLADGGQVLGSKWGILQKIVWQYLSRVGSAVPRCCVEEALGNIAWELQRSRKASLGADELFRILSAARNGREFGLYEFKDALVKDRNLLVRSGDEGVRFAFPPIQSYFVAKYLSEAPDKQFLLEDITASLGRMSRVRRWERVLALLACNCKDPSSLLRTILAGSTLMEGEQLFVAVRCFSEAHVEGGHLLDIDGVADQMTDSLMWRSIADGKRSNSERRKALEGLITLAILYPNRRQDIIPHLVRIACNPLTNGARPDAVSEFDNPDIRQLAASGAARFPELSTKYVESERPELVEALKAWWDVATDPSEMKALLLRDDPRVSVIAAAALAQTGSQDNWQTLLHGYSAVQNEDVKRGIVDALGTAADAVWIDNSVVSTWVKQSDASRTEHICLLVQKTLFASDETRAFLVKVLDIGSPVQKGKAMRALASLQDDNVDKWLRPRCEEIVKDRSNASYRDALLALCDIGDANSLAILRQQRGGCSGDCTLKALSYQVAEEIYWRLTGGLDGESFAGSAFQAKP